MLRFLRRLFLLVLLLSGILAAGIWWVFNSPVGLRTSPLDFTVAPGSSLRTAAQQVTDAGSLLPPIVLTALGRILGSMPRSRQVATRSARASRHSNCSRKLTWGDVTQAEILFVEGWTFRQLREKPMPTPMSVMNCAVFRKPNC